MRSGVNHAQENKNAIYHGWDWETCLIPTFFAPIFPLYERRVFLTEQDEFLRHKLKRGMTLRKGGIYLGSQNATDGAAPRGGGEG